MYNKHSGILGYEHGSELLKTLLVIPAYNEEDSIVQTIKDIRIAAPTVDYIVVNDGSTDATAALCREHKYPFLDLPVNLGLSGAFQAGMKYAYRHGYDCAIQFDADGQHRPEYIEALANATQDHDIVIGSRFVDSKKPFSLRMLGSWIIGKAIKLTTGKTIRDPTSGMRAFNARMIKQLAMGLNYGPEPDTVSFLIKKQDAKVAEIPVIMQERLAGESYLNLKNSILYMSRMTLSILLIQYFRR